MMIDDKSAQSGAPAPMAIEQLLSSSVLSAQAPQTLGPLESGAGSAPTPLSLGDLVERGEAAPEPEPMALRELGSPAGGKRSTER
jgi:hypothetical protein